MIYQLTAACGCNIGRVRTNNEDNFYFDGLSLPEENTGLSGYVVKKTYLEREACFGVFDGMGGEEYGEKASFAAVQTTQAKMDYCRKIAVGPKAMLKSLCDEMNREVCVQQHRLYVSRMGTTCAMLLFVPDEVYACNLGDSRIYHLRPRTGEVLYRSRDHSLVQQLYELGEISYNEMGTSQRKNIILKAMQPYQEERSKATLVHITDIRPGDYFYLCSDGMLEKMEDDELLSILSMDISDEEKASELVKRTADNADNHSAYLIHVKNVEHEPGDEQFLSDEEEARRKNKALNDTRKDEVWDGASKDSRVVTNPPHAAAPQKSSKKKYIYPLILLLLAIAAAAFLLFSGKSNKTDKDETNGQDTEKVAGQTGGEANDDAEDDESEKSIKEDILRQRGGAMEPDPEPQSLKPQTSGKNMPGANLNDVIEFQ